MWWTLIVLVFIFWLVSLGTPGPASGMLLVGWIVLLVARVIDIALTRRHIGA